MKEFKSLRTQLGNMLFKLEQVKSVSLALEDGLRNNSGGEFTPAMMLVTDLLREHEDNIRELMETM